MTSQLYGCRRRREIGGRPAPTAGAYNRAMRAPVIRPRASGLAIAVAAGLSLPAVARAEDPGGPPARGALYAVAGVGTPIGFFGVEGAYRIRPDLEVTLGTGLGLSAESAADNQLRVLQWAVMPRYRVGRGGSALTIGLGLSAGNYSHTYFSLCGSQEEYLDCNTPQSWRYTLWSNLEIGGEHWTSRRVAFRYFIGYGHILAQGPRRCEDPSSLGCQDTSNGPYANIPYTGMALGGWF
jgi:hypothetical protein